MFIQIVWMSIFLNHLAQAEGRSRIRCDYSSLFDLHVVCTPDVCNKHGTCIPNVSNSFTCQCDPGFVGPTCNQGSFD